MGATILPFILMGTLPSASGSTLSPAPAPAPATVPVGSGPSVSSRDRSSNPWDNLAVPVFQVIGAEGVMLLSIVAIDRVSTPWADGLLLAPPLAVGLSTCGIGAASRRYRGSCWHSMLGVGAGLVSGLVVFALFEAVPDLNPVTPNQDDTQVFANTIGAVAFTALIGIPGGSIIGWHIGKVPVRQSTVDQPVSSPYPVAIEPVNPPSRSLSLGRDVPIRFVVPLLSGRF